MRKMLFCQISPFAYKISVLKCKCLRWMSNIYNFKKIAKKKEYEKLPFLVCSHKSLIRRTLGDVDKNLQENKAVNLSIAAKEVTNILINPNEIFSFWSLVGACTKKKGYKEGLVIKLCEPAKGIGGGLCQFTNLIHWLTLHTSLQIIEHHHHDQIDLFPDFGRQVPFGVGTSIMHNYLDYRFINNTSEVYQLITWTTDEYLCGEIRSNEAPSFKYHIKNEDEYFSMEDGTVYRNGVIYRDCTDKRTGNLVKRELIKKNHARVLYDTDNIEKITH